MPICRDMIKNHELQFLSKLQGIDDAKKAQRLLRGVHGIETVDHTRRNHLRIRYDISQLTLQTITAALCDVGYLLDNRLLTRIKRSLIAYCEDTQRASIGIERATEQTSLNLPETVAHDPRPHNWRNYL